MVGYSFGAWVNSLINTQLRIHDLIMISPPVAFIRFDAKQPLSRLKRVITGSEDEIAPASMIQEMIPAWNPDAHSHIIDGADHFYTGYLYKLRNIVRNALSTGS
jgi:hypothetical protein